MDQSFSVTLVSNSNEEFFAHNTNFSFSNILPREMDLSEYEVALTSISFSDWYRKKTEQKKVEPSIRKPFFDLDNNDHEVIVTNVEMNQFRVDKNADNWHTFVTLLNKRLRDRNMRVRFGAHFKPGTEPPELRLMTLTIDEPEEKQFIIREPLNRCLGFSGERFSRGLTENDITPDYELFDSIKMNERIGHIQLFTTTEDKIYLEQFSEPPILSSLTTAVVAALGEKNYDISMRVLKDQSAIEFDIEGEFVEVMFSDFLNNYLGLEKSFKFKGTGAIIVPENVIDPNIVEVPILEKPKHQSCSKVLVLTNIISPQIFCGRELPILALVDRRESTDFKPFSFQLNPLIYKPVSVSRISQISISLLSDQMEYLPLHDQPSVCTLHFRLKRFV